LIVLVSDKNYLEHCKYLFTNIRHDTDYDGDLCLITNDQVDTSEFEKRNIHVKKFEKIDPFFQKLNIFNSYFKKWDKVLYLDCDTMVIKKELNKIFDLPNDLYCEPESWTVQEYFNGGKNPDLFQELKREYNVDKVGFNSGSILFNTSLIDDNTQNELFEIKEKYQEINEHTRKEGGDQPIINLKFIDTWEKFPNNEICYWRLYDSGYSKRVGLYNEEYKDKPNPESVIIYHFVHVYAPWINHTLSPYGMTYYDKYKTSIQKFNQLT
jgi:hypothetical protein